MQLGLVSGGDWLFLRAPMQREKPASQEGLVIYLREDMFFLGLVYRFSHPPNS